MTKHTAYKLAGKHEVECPGYCDLCGKFEWLHPTDSDEWFCDDCDGEP